METHPQTPLRRIRLQRNATLDEVARALEMNNGSLSRIETMKVQATPETAARLVRYFGDGITEMEILYPERFMGEGATREQ